MAKPKAESAETAEQVHEEAKSRPAPLLDIARKVLLAGVGAAALAGDEIEEFVDRLVERGEIAERDGRKLVKDVLERRKQSSRFEERIDRQIEQFVSRLNVPTKADVDALSSRIADLSKKIDVLKKSQP